MTPSDAALSDVSRYATHLSQADPTLASPLFPKSDERYRDLLDSLDVGFCVIEMLYDDEGRPNDYRFLEANPAFERNTGLENVIGKTVRDFVPNHDDFWFQIYGQVAQTGEPIRFEDHAVAMKRWFDVYAQRFGEAGENKVAVFFTDISARKDAEEALRQTEERELARLTDIFMRAPAFMAALRGPQHTYELANIPYLQLIGRHNPNDPEEIIGKTVAGVIPEMVDQGFIALLDQVYQSGEAFIGTDTPVAFRLSDDGPLDQHFVDFTFQPLLDDDGKVSGILVHGIDLTERKKLEREREQLLEQQRRYVDDLRDAGVRQRQFLKEMLLGFTEGRLRLCDTPDELPTPLTSLSGDIVIVGSQLRVLRKTVEAAAERVALPQERLTDFVTAVHEAAMNAVKYGGGGTAHVYGNTETGQVQVWVRDHGPGIGEEFIHRAVEQGWTTGGFGQGFFLMRSCSDRLFLLTGSGGTTIVLEIDRKAPLPAWLQ